MKGRERALLNTEKDRSDESIDGLLIGFILFPWCPFLTAREGGDTFGIFPSGKTIPIWKNPKYID
jgi:hypothetical protein